MSSETKTAKATPAERRERPYHFHVDGKPFTSEEAKVTGSQIKARAVVDPSFGLFLEGHGNDPNRPIRDDEVVDLSEPGVEKFYTVPPANFGATG